MTNGPFVTSDDRTLTVRVPLAFRNTRGRKVVLGPEGATRIAVSRRLDNAAVRALARAFRWRKLIEVGTYATVAEIGRVERVNDSYVSRLLRLTLLAPDIVEAIINQGRIPTIAVRSLTKPFPIEWRAQRQDLRTDPSFGNRLVATPA